MVRKPSIRAPGDSSDGASCNEPDDARDGPQLDAPAILREIGEVPYAWQIDTDRIAWGDNAGEVLKIDGVAAIATGRLYAQRLDPASSQSRFDTVMKSGHRDGGSGVGYQIEYCLRLDSGGEALWVEDTGRWFAGSDGRPATAHGVVRAINERHEREARLTYLSRFDALTGEMNRAHLTELLGATLDDAHRYRSSCAFLIAAIDNLARINEGFGFDIADEVIGAVGKRIRTKMRGGDVLGRFSGNKFGVILKNCTPDDMVIAAERLLTGVREDVVQTSAGPVAVTVTIGGVVAPRHARTVSEIVARAQESLDVAKAKRHGSFLAYRPSVEREAMRQESIRTTDKIVAALNERRILLAFEPVVGTLSRGPAFYESLMRIQRADGTLVSAGSVIAVAERLGLVRLLDHRVLELAVAELVAAPQLHLSINVSADSTTDPDWWAALGASLRRHPGIGERLIIEITETAAIHDLDETRAFVSRAKDLGCRIAIDDFGAGYTSFRNLRRLGVDLVKIDGAFVQHLTESADDRVFVRTLVELGRSLGLKIVAEWVQDETAADMLAEWGCDYLQGHLVGRAAVARPWQSATAATPQVVAAPA